MYNLDEYFNIKINHEDDFKAMKIKDDIKQKDEIYKKLNDNMDELFPIMEKISVCLKNISQNLLNLKNIYGDGHKCNETLSYCYQQLYFIIKTWGEDYIKQKNFLKTQFKYFFKYINKETNAFLKNFENYEEIKEEYKKKFIKFQKMQSPTTKELEYLNHYKNLYGLNLVHVIDEYSKLSERQGKRVNKQFFLFNKEKELLFQDYDNFYRLFNFKENYSLPDVSVSYAGKPNEILNQLNISKISKISKNEKEANNEKEEKIENNEYNEKDIENEEKEETEEKEEKDEKEEKIENYENNENNENNEKNEKNESLNKEEDNLYNENNENNEKENEELKDENDENNINDSN